MEFKELLTKRYAAKLFQPKAVPEETMQELLEMVRLAPSGLNIQPWRIKVVSDPATKDEAVRRRSRRAADHELLASPGVLRRHRLGGPDPAPRPGHEGAHRPGQGLGDRHGHRRRDGRGCPKPNCGRGIIGQVYIAATYALAGRAVLGSRLLPDDPLRCRRVRARSSDCRPEIVPVLLLAVGYAADEPRPKWRYPLGDILI